MQLLLCIHSTALVWCTAQGNKLVRAARRDTAEQRLCACKPCRGLTTQPVLHSTASCKLQAAQGSNLLQGSSTVMGSSPTLLADVRALAVDKAA